MNWPPLRCPATALAIDGFSATQRILRGMVKVGAAAFVLMSRQKVSIGARHLEGIRDSQGDMPME